MRPLGFHITKCKIYTRKWGNDETPRNEPLEILITKCKIYTRKWGNDETPVMSPWDFTSRNVKFTRGNGAMMRGLRFRKSERL